MNNDSKNVEPDEAVSKVSTTELLSHFHLLTTIDNPDEVFAFAEQLITTICPQSTMCLDDDGTVEVFYGSDLEFIGGNLSDLERCLLSPEFKAILDNKSSSTNIEVLKVLEKYLETPEECISDEVCPCGSGCEVYCKYQGWLEEFWNQSNLQDVSFVYDKRGCITVVYEAWSKHLKMTMFELYQNLSLFDESLNDKEFLSHFGIQEYDVSFSHLAFINNMADMSDFSRYLPKLKTFFDSIGYCFTYAGNVVRLDFNDGHVLCFSIDRLCDAFSMPWNIATIMLGNINSTDMHGYLKGFACDKDGE
ncbi:hypothetical protein L4P95_004780 [Pseudomonas aeruginosa]|nr:hypothetical protein [Pseudomonas aeruginosa]